MDILGLSARSTSPLPRTDLLTLLARGNDLFSVLDTLELSPELLKQDLVRASALQKVLASIPSLSKENIVHTVETNKTTETLSLAKIQSVALPQLEYLALLKLPPSVLLPQNLKLHVTKDGLLHASLPTEQNLSSASPHSTLNASSGFDKKGLQTITAEKLAPNLLTRVDSDNSAPKLDPQLVKTAIEFLKSTIRQESRFPEWVKAINDTVRVVSHEAKTALPTNHLPNTEQGHLPPIKEAVQRFEKTLPNLISPNFSKELSKAVHDNQLAQPELRIIPGREQGAPNIRYSIASTALENSTNPLLQLIKELKSIPALEKSNSDIALLHNKHLLDKLPAPAHATTIAAGHAARIDVQVSKMLELADSALVKVLANQLRSMIGSSETMTQHFVDLPLRIFEQIIPFHFVFSSELRDKEERKKNSTEKQSKRRWKVFLEWDVEGAGKMSCELGFSDNKLNASVWADEQPLRDRVKAKLGDLYEAFCQQELDVEQLVCHAIGPRHDAAGSSTPLVDIES